MAEKERNSSGVAQSRNRSAKKKPNGGRKRQIIGLLGMVLGVLILLSLVSYTSSDQANGDVRFVDLWKVFSNDPVIRAKAEGTRNWLGLLGAILSNLLINTTIGYAVIIFPILLFAWGWTLLREGNYGKLALFSNYVLILALLLCSLFGVVRLLSLPPLMTMEWSGVVGDFIATVLARLIGIVGASIALCVTLFIVVVLAIDLDLKTSIDRLKGLLQKGEGRFSVRRKEHEEIEIAMPEEEEHTTAPIFVSREEEKPEEPEVDEPMTRSEETEIELPSKREGSLSGRVQEDVSVRRGRDVDEEIDYVLPTIDLLNPPYQQETLDEDELKGNAELLRAKLANFGVEIESVSVTPGPVVTLYELVPASGVKISRIVSLADDLALALAAKGIRIMAPIPGKSAVGVEIPNRNPIIVQIRSVINSTKFRETKATLPIAVGKTISGEVYTDDLAKMPHLLMAGATGSGKSIGINTIIASLLYRLHPSDVKFVIIDPKKIELSVFAKLKNHYLAVCPDIHELIVTTPENSVLALKSVEYEMEQRYDRLAAAGVRNVADYNERVREGRMKDSQGTKHKKIPYLIVVIDELADLMLTASREVEEPIARLAQLARAVGIHLVVATQRPSVDVITGVIKANFSARIAYQVASKIDSRTILDMNGADQLLGNGDMLYMPAGSPKPVRIQNAFISTEEVERVTDYIANQPGYSHPFQLPSVREKERGAAAIPGERDDLFLEAARLVVRHQQGSVSLLQRRLAIGYSRAGKLIDQLEGLGIVGPYDGSKAREVLVETEEELENLLGQER
ncbi:MAG: DNA translocase FtsK 4TM domain-containing protein [Bacteroidota bacterium]